MRHSIPFLCALWLIGVVGESYVADEFLEIITAHIHSNMSLASVGFGSLAKAHLIRVPKASSSSLSAIVRRIVGCNPPGPCCKYPGHPPGSCPAPKNDPNLLFRCQEKVIGCTHHYPYIERLSDPYIKRMVSISMMREPISRALSAFSYVPPHSNRRGKCKDGYSESCFLSYTKSATWNNIAVKMFAGSFAYDAQSACREGCKNNLKTALCNLEKLTVMGITEMWAISILVLYAKIPTLRPQREDFSPYSLGDRGGSRENKDVAYSTFKRTARITYSEELHAQNGLDIDLYKAALTKLCDDLHSTGLWNNAPVQREWWAAKSKLGEVYSEAATKCSAKNQTV